MICAKCGKSLVIGMWPYCPHEWGAHVTVIDDQLDGGPRLFETLGHDEVYIESKSQLRRELAVRGLDNVVRHEQAYYDRQRRQLDELARDEARS